MPPVLHLHPLYIFPQNHILLLQKTNPIRSPFQFNLTLIPIAFILLSQFLITFPPNLTLSSLITHLRHLWMMHHTFHFARLHLKIYLCVWTYQHLSLSRKYIRLQSFGSHMTVVHWISRYQGMTMRHYQCLLTRSIWLLRSKRWSLQLLPHNRSILLNHLTTRTQPRWYSYLLIIDDNMLYTLHSMLPSHYSMLSCHDSLPILLYILLMSIKFRGWLFRFAGFLLISIMWIL